MSQQYQPGQRWISDSEAELGLGTVLTSDGRLLTVLYPATGDTRQYALRNAPLTRVRFAPGDEITHFEGWKLTVQEVEDIDGLRSTTASTASTNHAACRKPNCRTSFSSAWPAIACSPDRSTHYPGLPCAITLTSIRTACCNRLSGASAACVRNLLPTSCISPAK